MAKQTILAIQNSSFEHLGTLQSMFEKDGFAIDTVIPSKGHKVPTKLNDYLALVILGGPASVYDDHQYLKEEERLIKDAMTNNIPALGICLGSQLIAKASGARVYNGARVYKGARKEIGWYPVELTQDGMSDIFKGLKKNVIVFQWHGDTYDLPPHAINLAKSDLYPVQAFRVKSAIGIQFHLEVSKEMVMDWIIEYEDELKSVSDYIRVNDIIKGFNTNSDKLKECSRVLYTNFKNLIN